MKLEKLKIFLGDWYEPLSEFVTEDIVKNINIAGQQYAKTKCYPPASQVFRAFTETPYSETKVVILGQDPYPNENATGLAFDCGTNRMSPSMVSIEKAYRSYDPNHFNTKILDGRTHQWCKEGVLLLNTALTVEKGKPNSHKHLWLDFTKTVIKALNRKDHIIYLLWGKEAQDFGVLVNRSHTILKAEHPVAPRYQGREWDHGDFFNLTNKILKEKGKQEIKW